MKNLLQINKDALEAWGAADFSTAFTLFKRNAEENPCHLTLNNFGKFCCDEGQLQKNGRWRSAKSVGLRYMIKASQMERRSLNLFNIATVLYSLGRVGEAFLYFQDAFTIEPTSTTQYNIGVCLLTSGNYEEAEKIFSLLKKKDVSEILSHGGVDPAVPYAFSQCLTNVHLGTLDTEQIESLPATGDEKIALFYLCGNFRSVIEYSPIILSEWHLEDSLIAMIFDSIDKENHLAEEKKVEVLKLISSNYKEMKTLASCADERDKCIKQFTYVPPLAELCGYYGCPVHNTPV